MKRPGERLFAHGNSQRAKVKVQLSRLKLEVWLKLLLLELQANVIFYCVGFHEEAVGGRACGWGGQYKARLRG